jgi:hypothetical protein
MARHGTFIRKSNEYFSLAERYCGPCRGRATSTMPTCGRFPYGRGLLAFGLPLPQGTVEPYRPLTSFRRIVAALLVPAACGGQYEAILTRLQQVKPPAAPPRRQRGYELGQRFPDFRFLVGFAFVGALALFDQVPQSLRGGGRLSGI